MTPESVTQVDRFKEAARALECDEDDAVLDEKLKTIAKQKVKGLVDQLPDDDVAGSRKRK